MRPRVGAGVERQLRNASAAASTAERASSRVAKGASPSMSSVFAGLVLGTVFDEVDLIHLPAMKF